MVAKEASLKEIVECEPYRLEIPFFQRRYVWEEENWEELLQDVENSKSEKIFWGSIIIKEVQEKVSDGKGHAYSRGYVIDGQQRLTTIALLTKAIYDAYGQKDSWCEDLIKYDLFFSPYKSASQDEYQIIIQHSRVDREEFEYILKTGVYDNEKIDYSQEKGGQIRRCYSYFRKMLESKSQHELAELADDLYGSEKVFVLISLDEKDVNEQTIFDSINRAGQKLYTSDIVKNNLFKHFMRLEKDEKKACELCDTYWDNIFWKDTFWDEDRQFGNVRKSHLDFLLYSVACIKWSDEPLQNINDNLESVFERRTSEYQKEELVKLIHDIACYALIYKKYIYEFGEHIDEMTFSKSEHLNRLLLIMNKFKIQMFYPYILKMLHENVMWSDIKNGSVTCDVQNQKLNKEARVLEAYIVRRRICGASTSAYSKKCMEILQKGIKHLFSDYKLDSNLSMVEEENRAIEEALKTIKNQDVAKIVLFCIELTRWNEKDDMEELPFNYQLEHIMPQKWKEHWKLASYSSEDERNAKIKEIGNMILLSQGLNKQIQNSEYSIKMEGVHDGKKNKAGYKERTQLKMTKEIVDQYYIQNDKVWDEKHIAARTVKISTEVIKHWNISKLMEELE
jgi:uncharacterized protein with ParB-like and HNH nuclease domain